MNDFTRPVRHLPQGKTIQRWSNDMDSPIKEMKRLAGKTFALLHNGKLFVSDDGGHYLPCRIVLLADLDKQ